jgi:hypothetical protein
LTLTPIRKCYFPAKLRARLIIPDEKFGKGGYEMHGLRLSFGWITIRIAFWIAVSFLLLAPGVRGQSSAAGSAPPSAGPAQSGSPGSIVGIVAGKDGEAYEGVRVALVLGDAQPAETLDTDSDGEFTFSGVPAGAFTLTISSEGFATQSVTGVLHPGETYNAQTIVLTVKEATSVVRVSAAAQEEIAEEQIHIEEKQRVLGVLPNYYVSYAKNPVPLTARQKFELALRSNIDPFTFLLSGVFAGVEQADNTFEGYGQGVQGYGKRFGAYYADTVISNEIGGAILPSLFHQDPRYFYKGTGSIRARTEYAIANAVVCKGDNMRWQLNYSGLLGGIASGAISNLYYPQKDRSGVALTFENTAVGLAGSALQNIVQEFVIKKLTPSARRAAQQ